MPVSMSRSRWVLLGASAAGLVLIFLLRRAIAVLISQMAAALVLMALALPIARRLENKWSANASAGAALLSLLVGVGLLLALLMPPLIRQVSQVAEALPGAVDWARSLLGQWSAWMTLHGIDASHLQGEAVTRLSALAGQAAGTLMASLRKALSTLGQVMLSPLLAFYLLRDRKRLSVALTLLLPVGCRARGVRAARELRRETALYVRGQLLLSAAVGTLTALALALVGVPGALVLGVLMGILELVPYIGPVVAGAMAVVMALQGGWSMTLWTLGAVVAVQQVEGNLLSPRLLAGATQLHPLTVLLGVSAGGAVGGIWGMVLVLPGIVMIRGALRGWRED